MATEATEDFLVTEHNSHDFSDQEEGATKPSGEDGTLEKHRSSEGKSSKHKHKRHKHKHRKKHRKNHGDASTDEIGSNRGSADHPHGESGVLNSLMADIKLEGLQNEHGREECCMTLSPMDLKESLKMASSGTHTSNAGSHDKNSAHKWVKSAESVGIRGKTPLDDEMEEGEIVDEEPTNCKATESDTESGEIHTSEKVVGISNANHKVCSMMDSIPGEQGGTVAPALQSMLGIAEAYNSDQGSDGMNVVVRAKSKAAPPLYGMQGNCSGNDRQRLNLSHKIEPTSPDSSAEHASEKALRRKRSRSPESSMYEALIRRHQSPLQGSRENPEAYYTKMSPFHDVSGQSRSEESGKDHRDFSVRERSVSVRERSIREVESIASEYRRRSRSREHMIYLRNHGESRERADESHRSDNREIRRRSISRDTDVEAKVSPGKNVRGRRSRSREASRDHGEKYERSDRGRRSRSKERAYDMKYSRDNSGRRERARRSRSRDSRDIKRYEHGRRSRSRDTAQESRYGKDTQERSERGRRSRSREISRGYRHATEEQWRPRDAAYDSQDRRDYRSRYDQRRSRSRDGDRVRMSVQECADRRRRSLSRGGRDSFDRRKSSPSRGSRGDSDRRRCSRSKESPRGLKMSEQDSHRSVQQTRGERHDRLVQTRGRIDTAHDKDLKGSDAIMRGDEDVEDHQDNLHSDEDDDVEKEVEKIRMRRQAIIEKHRKQMQSQSDSNMRLDAKLGESDLTKDTELVVVEKMPVVSDDSRKALDLGKSAVQNGLQGKPGGTKGLGEGTPKSEEKSNDMFSDYIFGDSPAGVRKLVKGDGLAFETSGLTDNWDDAEGYYCYRIGEVLDGHFEVAASHGKGVFSSVVRARDLRPARKDGEEVAIKIIRNNDVMLKSGQQELSILKKLVGADPENRRHCVRFLSNFDYRKHLCLVFESMHMNLRELLKKFGRNIGLNLSAVRAYAKQLFIALKHLRNCGVLHCDIKPDNMLVNEAKNVLKLCDFGSAMFAGENEITPYLVSRFYRAPEIILGLPYDHPLDMWSVGCCLYEFFTGKVLFPGPTNNDMLRLHMELKGPFPKKMLKKAGFVSKHFDQDYNFCAIEEDPVTKASIKRVLTNVKPKDIGSLLTGQGTADGDPRLLAHFKDLLDKIFMLDPEKRLTVSQALSHPFVSGK